MSGLRESQMNTRNQFMLDAYGTGMNTALANRNQPINEITALLSGSQVSHPNFVSPNTSKAATTDVAGIINNNYQQELAGWQQQQQGQNSLMGGLFGLGAAGIKAGMFGGAGALALSDIRMKENIIRIGTRSDGLNVYSFDYKGGAKGQVGFMAQEVEGVYPEAVKTISGVKHVDYGKVEELSQ
jgi:hypothetical protein